MYGGLNPSCFVFTCVFYCATLLRGKHSAMTFVQKLRNTTGKQRGEKQNLTLFRRNKTCNFLICPNKEFISIFLFYSLADEQIYRSREQA